MSESNLLKHVYDAIFKYFHPDPDPPVRVAGRIRKLVSFYRFYPNASLPLSSLQNVCNVEMKGLILVDWSKLESELFEEHWNIFSYKSKSGEKPDSDPNLVAKIQFGVVGLRHDSGDNSGTHRHTTGQIFKTSDLTLWLQNFISTLVLCWCSKWRMRRCRVLHML